MSVAADAAPSRAGAEAAAALRPALAQVHVYVATPFTADLETVDTVALHANLRALVERGVRVLAVGGGTGEADALGEREHVLLAETALDAVADDALVVATLPGNLAAATEVGRSYERMGVQVALALAPLVRGAAPGDPAGIADYYRALGARLDLPLMPYNSQSWPASVLEELAPVDTVVAIKDACQDPHPMFRAIQRLGDRFVWVGNKRHDPGIVQLRYAMGMETFTSGMANFFPEPELALHDAARSGDTEQAVALQRQCAPFERLRLAGDDAAAVKAGMDLCGFRGGPVRPPRRPISPAARSELGAVLRQMGAT